VEAVETALARAVRGFTAVKPRVRGGARSDAKLLEAVRNALPKNLHTMLDANEKCDLVSTRWLLAVARELGALFVEEPLPANALEGY
jgi:L-alanine-DL-glutamate epimerase-like enolase superfamily enzyme